MNEYDSPNYTDFTYEKKAVGRQKLLKRLFVLGYLLFVLAYFLFCYITRIIPLFAVCPIFTWILVYFTWGYVSFDVYYTFNHGDMELGRLKKKKNGAVRKPVVKLNVKSAQLIAPYNEAVVSEEYKSARRYYDFSSGTDIEKTAVAIFPTDKGSVAVSFLLSPRSASLISSFSPNVKNLKNAVK